MNLDIDKILDDKLTPNSPDKLRELLSRVHTQLDERLSNIEQLVDVQGSDLIKCVVYVMAFERALIQSKIISESDLKNLMNEAANKLKEDFTKPSQEDTSDLNDIEI